MADFDQVHERINKLSEAVVRTDERVTRHRDEINNLTADLKSLIASVGRIGDEMRAANQRTNETIMRVFWMFGGMALLFSFWKSGGFDFLASLMGGIPAVK